MKRRLSSLLILLLFAGGCAVFQPAERVTPDTVAKVADSLEAAQADPTVAKAGADALKTARSALARARTLQGAEARQALYHAEHAIELAREAARQARLRDAIAQLKRRRQDLQQELAELREKARAEARLQADFAGFEQVGTTERGIHLLLPLPNFSASGLRLDNDDRQALDQLAAWLHAHPRRNLMIETFTDNTGTSDFNLRVTSTQARDLQSYLAQHGVNAARMVTRAYGEAFPMESNATPVGRVHNRRAEFIISDESGVIPPRATPPNGH